MGRDLRHNEDDEDEDEDDEDDEDDVRRWRSSPMATMPWPQAFGRRVTEDGADDELGSPARGRSPREGESNAAIRDSLRLSVPE